MDPKRLAWLDGIADRVPRLLDGVRAGSHKCAFILGERNVDGRRVQLTLRAQVVEGVPLADDGEPLPLPVPPTLAPRSGGESES